MNKSFSITIRNKNNKFSKIIYVDADKSITHRALFLSSQCRGISNLKGLESEDVDSTIQGLRNLGVKIIKKKNCYQVYGNGIGSINHHKNLIYCGNSGTSARFFLGLLSTYPYPITVTGDNSLKKRPMKRVTKHLELIGARINKIFKKNLNLPFMIEGTNFPLAQSHKLESPSAQVKTAILLSSLNTPGITEIVEKHNTRNHTELLLKKIGADIKVLKVKNKKIITIKGQHEMNSFNYIIPCDPSSACFFIVQTLLTNNSSLLLKNVIACYFSYFIVAIIINFFLGTPCQLYEDFARLYRLIHCLILVFNTKLLIHITQMKINSTFTDE